MSKMKVKVSIEETVEKKTSRNCDHIDKYLLPVLAWTILTKARNHLIGLVQTHGGKQKCLQ